MATPYTQVYDFFLGKVEDYSFIDKTKYPTDEDLHQEFYQYMRSAITRFTSSKVNLQDRDDGAKQFNTDLTDTEQEIISLLMVVQYLTPKINSTENLRPKMSDREYKEYSKANHLSEMRKLKKDMESEAHSLIGTYSYSNGLLELR